MKLCILLLLLLVLLVVNVVQGMVDIFMSKEEVNRTIGHNAALTYVNEGVVHAYAAGFAYLVRHNINHINFLWRSKAPDPVKYSLKVIVPTYPEALQVSLTNIRTKGTIPNELEAFTIWLKCTGMRLGELRVEIQLNYTWPSYLNATNLHLIRRKICTSDSLLDDEDVEVPDSEETVRQFKQIEYETQHTHSPQFPRVSAGQVFYVTIGCVCGFVVVMGSLVVTYLRRVKKPSTHNHRLSTYSGQTTASPGYRGQCQPFLRPESPSTISKYSSRRSGSIYSSVTGASHCVSHPPNNGVVHSPIVCVDAPVIDVKRIVHELKVDQAQLTLGQVIMQGTFGCVKSGVLSYGSPTGNVIVKCLKESSAMETQKTSFLHESLAFHNLPAHRNLSQAVAIVYGDSDIPMLCYAHSGMGNLKKFLLRCRGVEPGASVALSTQNLVWMSVQVCSALMHLHDHKIIHRDVAARNCLVHEDLTVQLCDTGLSRDLFSTDYHCLQDGENRPVKWMSVESIEKHIYSSAGDVWAFGVFIWELFTLALQPYADNDAEDMITLLRQGSRLTQPYNCPDELYGVVLCCWSNSATSRPSVIQLHSALSHFHEQLCIYI